MPTFITHDRAGYPALVNIPEWRLSFAKRWLRTLSGAAPGSYIMSVYQSHLESLGIEVRRLTTPAIDALAGEIGAYLSRNERRVA